MGDDVMDQQKYPSVAIVLVLALVNAENDTATYHPELGTYSLKSLSIRRGGS
jgi:hypothetical protein